MAILIGGLPPAKRVITRTVLAWLVATTVLVAWHQRANAQDGQREYAVKAAYLAKIGSFIEWPKSVFASPSSAINLCVTGQDVFGDALDRAVANQRIGERPIVVRRLPAAARNANCQILYIGGSDGPSLDQALDATRGANVFTVTDATPTGSVSSVLQFVIRDNRVRFIIDEQAASQNGISISSDLLKLALSVKPRR